MGLAAELGPGPVAVDTGVFIYFIEEEPRYLPLIEELFEEADSGRRELITSAVTVLEVLVVPYRLGALELAQRYELLLTRSRGIQVVDLTQSLLKIAAQLRAATMMRTRDAIQIASALSANCRTYLTTDLSLPVVHGITVLQLSSYLKRE